MRIAEQAEVLIRRIGFIIQAGSGRIQVKKRFACPLGDGFAAYGYLRLAVILEFGAENAGDA